MRYYKINLIILFFVIFITRYYAHARENKEDQNPNSLGGRMMAKATRAASRVKERLNNKKGTEYTTISGSEDSGEFSKKRKRDNQITGKKCNNNLPIIKYGSRPNELKICESKILTNQSILTNTCRFDSLVSIIMVAYCDSDKYSAKIDSIGNDFLTFISKIAKNGITSSTYCDRADLIINKTNPATEAGHYSVVITSDGTINELVDLMFEDIPTATEKKRCPTTCQLTTDPSIKRRSYITYTSNNGAITDLQGFLNKRFEPEGCKNIKSDIVCECEFISDISDMHLLIEIVYWNDKELAGENQYIFNTTAQVEMKLFNIPKLLMYNSVSYKLRGVISLKQPEMKTMTSIGHYVAYAVRGEDNWQLFNDLNNKPMSIGKKEKVKCDLLVYTI